jgi:hypothetical protein
MSLSTAEVSPFLAWFSEWGQVVYFFAQIVFWVFIAAAAVEIALAYNRYVDHKTGAAQAKAEKKAAKAGGISPVLVPPSAPASTSVDVDKFVE